MGTSGTVVPLFRRQIETTNVINVTDPAMTRFVLTRAEAMELILWAAESTMGGEVYVKKMPIISVGHLAELMREKIGNDRTRIDVIGPRRGERTHELLVSAPEAPRVLDAGQWYVVLPETGGDAETWRAPGARPVSALSPSSEHGEPLSDDELTGMLDHDAVD